MAKLKNIINQLSEEDYLTIYDSLINSSAEKSAYLLKHMRSQQYNDSKIMDLLQVNANAYYTLRSRLNQKIEEYLLQQLESPRAEILKKVSNISEVVFTKSKAIAIATLQKMEKELQDFDLSHELTVVYKYLKNLHLNSEEYFTYSQLYNKHVAYTLALDKAEGLLADFFQKFGYFYVNGGEELKIKLKVLADELQNVSKLYKSHRLFVFNAIVGIYYRLYLDDENNSKSAQQQPIEDIINQVEEIFDDYYTDAIYYNLKIVFELLKFEYYFHYRLYDKSDIYYGEVNRQSGLMLNNYHFYSFPGVFMSSKLRRAIRLGEGESLADEDETLYMDFEPDEEDFSNYVMYTFYRTFSLYSAHRYEEASIRLYQLQNEVSFKDYPNTHMEVKTFLAYQYCLQGEYDLLNQMINSVQRQIRLSEGSVTEHLSQFIKFMKLLASSTKKNKKEKAEAIFEKIQEISPYHFSPIKLIQLNEHLLTKLD